MKKIFGFVIVASLMIATGCKKEDGDDKTVTCSKPQYSVTGYNGQAEVYIESPGNAGFFEIEYGPNGFTQGQGTKFNASYNTNIPNLSNGTYDMYVRANCGGSDYSEWELKSFIVTGGGNSSCLLPMNIQANHNGFDYTLSWTVNGPGEDYYQIEYGPTGFTKGTGTVINSADEYYSMDFPQGQTYDFYVRSNCGGNDFSTWAGPTSFYAEF